MGTVRTALYLDFDNVFSGLMKLDPTAATRFAREPKVWVDRLRSRLLTDGERRWLVLRCYMNPDGSIEQASGERVVFRRFRKPFSDAGFEIVDCPRLAHAKNGADIRMALDAAEALHADVRYEEFVVVSGDSDMTPLLVRLRAADRRRTVVTASDSAFVLEAVADRLVRGEELLGLLEDEVAVPEVEVPPVGDDGQASDEATRFSRLFVERYRAAEGPINQATLAHQLRADLGGDSGKGWAGHSSLTKALQSLDLPGLSISHNFVWDSRRHDPPPEAQPVVAPEQTPDPVERVTTVLRLPRLAQGTWRPIYWALASHLERHAFDVTETIRWTRQQLADGGVEVEAKDITVVIRGSAWGGTPLFREPAPSAEEIERAFVGNVVNRARKADVELSADDVTLRLHTDRR